MFLKIAVLLHEGLKKEINRKAALRFKMQVTAKQQTMLTFNKNQETKVRIFHASWAAHWFDNRDSRQVQGSFISETE